ncbi:MAG TPA: hypothetical protein VK498_10030 [Ferruginibacter sp.]|nr:hypothetical protein [Ferruginibacter sp.]
MKHLKIHQLFIIAILQFAFFSTGMAQYKTFSLNSKGDTINAVTQKGVKHGKWVIHVDELRGEPGFEEEGIFKNGVKEGIWRKYNLEGDLVAIEHFKNGGKHGLQQYYTYLGDLVREESWKGYDPDAPYDTIAVYGTGSNEIVDYRIVKAEQYSVKNGEWKYYDPGTGQLVKTEQWERNNLVLPEAPKKDVVANVKKKEVAKTTQMLEWEKKNRGKKKVVRDGKTGL